MLEAARVPTERRALRRAADVRYRRQAYELTVPIADGPVTRERLDALAASFHDRHRRPMATPTRTSAVQLVNLRLTASGRSPELVLRQHGGGSRPGARSAPRGSPKPGSCRARCIGATVSTQARR